MSAFVIYAVILTLAYLIYYSAMVSSELYAHKDQAKDTTETFDIAGMDDQIESVTVNESKDGFYLGEPDTGQDDDDGEVMDEVAHAGPHSGPAYEQAEDGSSEAIRHAESAEAMMEDITPEYPEQFEPDEFDAVLLNPANTVPVIITMDTRDEI